MRTRSARQRAWAGAITISSLCAHYTTVLMTLPEGSAPKAVWNDIETQELINFLHEKRSESEAGNFKATTYNAAAKHIAEHHTQGPVKNGPMCKTKWSGIKQIYTAIETYRNQSGFHWDSSRGANIVGDAAEAVWKAYTVKSNACLRQFRNHGWQHYDKVQEIIPGNRARGTHAYRPAMAPLPIPMNEPDQSTSGAGTSVAPLQESSMIVAPTSIHSTAFHSTTGINPIDKNSGGDSSSMALQPLSNQSGKRSYDAMSTETSGQVPDSLSEFATSFGPPTKLQKGKAAEHGVVGLRGSRSRSRPSGNQIAAANSARLAKITPATAVVGMQGSINRLTDVFEKSMTQGDEPGVERRARALQLVQQTQDGLSVDDKVALIALFMKDDVAIETYLSLNDPEIRQAWITSMLPVKL